MNGNSPGGSSSCRDVVSHVDGLDLDPGVGLAPIAARRHRWIVRIPWRNARRRPALRRASRARRNGVPRGGSRRRLDGGRRLAGARARRRAGRGSVRRRTRGTRSAPRRSPTATRSRSSRPCPAARSSSPRSRSRSTMRCARSPRRRRRDRDVHRHHARRRSRGRDVVRLEYEAYEGMAGVMEDIAAELVAPPRPHGDRHPPPCRRRRDRRTVGRDRRLGTAPGSRAGGVPRGDRHAEGCPAVEEGGLRGRRGVDRTGG